MVAKEFVSPRRLIRDSFCLARQVYDSGFRPEVLLALWRGGTPVAIVVHEFFAYKGIRPFHAAVKVESYTGIGQRTAPRIEQLEPVIQSIRPGASVLIIDDIVDTGETIRAVKDRLAERTTAIRVAVLYCKKNGAPATYTPDFLVRRTKKWIVFPHELVDLSLDEIKAKDGYIHNLLA